jgi:hypothetical protein
MLDLDDMPMDDIEEAEEISALPTKRKPGDEDPITEYKDGEAQVSYWGGLGMVFTFVARTHV